MDTLSKCNRIKEMLSGLVPMIQEQFQKDGPDVEEFIREQLYAGVDGNDQPLTPTYLDDPYFVERYGPHAAKKANNYVTYKKRITSPTPSYLGYPARDPNTPNLIIQGDFYSSITAKPITGGLRVESLGTTFGKDVESKYGSQIFGIGARSREYYFKYGLRPAIKNYLKGYGIK